MALGLSQANFADAVLVALDTTTANLICSHIDLHTADPGSAGLTAPFTTWTGTPTRKTLTWQAAGSITGTTTRTRAIIATLPTWAITGAGTVSHVSVWNASTGGSFRFSAALTASKTVANGDTLNLTALQFSLTPVAT